MAKASFRHARESERGQVFVIVVGGIVVLLGMVALAVDLGFWRNQQRLEQSAADSAAIAGSIATYFATTPAAPAPPEVKSAAFLATTKDGYPDDNGVGVTTVTVNNPPLSGPHTTDPDAVEVIVAKKQPVFFAGIFGVKSQTVRTRAVAAHLIDAAPACYYQMLQTSSTYFNSGSFIAKNCAIAINGPMRVGGSISATGISYYGSAPTSGTPYSGTQTSIPTPITDPCIRIPGCNYISRQTLPIIVPLSATPSATTTHFTAPSSPGYLYVAGPILRTSIFDPGIYYIYGGIAAGVSGTGVTLVNVDGAYVGGGSSPAVVTAPSTGPSLGVAFYQPPANTNAVVVGGSTTTWNGLFYAPTSTFTSNGKLDVYSELVIGGFVLNGSKSVTIDPSLGPSLYGVQQAQTTTHAGLAE